MMMNLHTHPSGTIVSRSVPPPSAPLTHTPPKGQPPSHCGAVALPQGIWHSHGPNAVLSVPPPSGPPFSAPLAHTSPPGQPPPHWGAVVSPHGVRHEQPIRASLPPFSGPPKSGPPFSAPLAQTKFSGHVPSHVGNSAPPHAGRSHGKTSLPVWRWKLARSRSHEAEGFGWESQSCASQYALQMPRADRLRPSQAVSLGGVC